MNIGIQAFGTRGDVMPFLALAIGLKKDGHNVSVSVTSPLEIDFSIYEDQLGIEITQTRGTQSEVESWSKMSTAEAVEFITQLKEKYVIPGAEKICSTNDIVIGLEGSYYLQAYAEVHDIPYITVSYQHSLTPTKNRAYMFHQLDEIQSKQDVLTSWEVVEKYINDEFSEHVNGFRTKLGLHPLDNLYRQVTHSPELQLLSMSSVFCEQYDDWENHRYVCGYFALDNMLEVSSIPETLEHFLKEGEAPIFFTLGSFNYRNDSSIDITKIFIETAKKLGRRVIIQSKSLINHQAEIDSNENIYVLNDIIDYKDVLPRCAMAIHHGGAGTSHIVLSCGCPSIILYSDADTPVWAHELFRIGVGEAIALNEISESVLIEKITHILNDSSFKQKSMGVSQIMAKENGVERAVKIINEKYDLISV